MSRPTPQSKPFERGDGAIELLFFFTLSDLRGEVRCTMQQKMLHAIELEDWQGALQTAPPTEQTGVHQDVWFQMIHALRGASSSEEEILMLRAALRKAPRCIGLYHGIVRLHLKQRNIEQATYWWSIGIKIDPHNALLWLLGSQIALLQDDLPTAEIRHQSASRFVNQDDPLLQRTAGRMDMARACTLWGKGQHEQALFWMLRALRYDPSWAEPWEALAQYLELMGCKERAAWYAAEARIRRKEAHLN